ncbi:MAG: hypothetical protein A3F89_07080 [Deltaproteobacteria bacterium RIFCSPLOWO2_12_FULL_50_11]|nr:MAG: hypothetical protein A3F89_07080 [Deltaproteobacteria bacterium RIFCSPLOWO2_12_FULL_50_11]
MQKKGARVTKELGEPWKMGGKQGLCLSISLEKDALSRLLDRGDGVQVWFWGHRHQHSGRLGK